jgi:hypothetical protein
MGSAKVAAFGPPQQAHGAQAARAVARGGEARVVLGARGGAEDRDGGAVGAPGAARVRPLAPGRGGGECLAQVEG